MTSPEEVLQACTIEGTIVKLQPQQLSSDLYLQVKGKLELIGGKWKGGKVQGFIFQQDPSEFLSQVANGEKRNLKKEYQFFATPDVIADELVERADLEGHHTVLEPSAGQGAIIKAIHRKYPNMYVDYYELMDLNLSFLEKIPKTFFIDKDFLQDSSTEYDRIIANPPFAKNQDIEHIMKMYTRLKPDGRLVSIASQHWDFASGKKEQRFRDFLKETDAEITVLPKDTFKESGTSIEMRIIAINKK